jgi:hypothetical protein
MPAIPALGRLKQEDHEFEPSLGYIDLVSKKTNKKRGKKKNGPCL